MNFPFMKKVYFFATLFCMVIINHQGLISQTHYGGYSEPWLTRNVGARPIAMGGVNSAIVNEPSGIFYNPAGSAFMSHTPTFNTSVSMLGFGRTNATLAYGQEILPSFGVGFGFNNNYAGSFTGRNIKGAPTKELNNNQISAMLGASYRFEFISMGAAIKYLNNSLNGASISANGIAYDLGIKLNVLDLFSFGLAMNNIGGTMKWNTASEISENIPYIIRTGVAAEFGINEETYVTRATITGEEETISIPPTRYLLLGMDAVMHQYDASPSFILGAEIVPHELVALRGGLSIYGDKEGTTQILPMNYWGAGVSFRPQLDLGFNIHIDYSISNEFINDSRVAHTVSMIFELYE